MTFPVVHHHSSWTLSERAFFLSLASAAVASGMALLTAGAHWLAATAVFIVTALWAAARISASELHL